LNKATNGARALCLLMCAICADGAVGQTAKAQVVVDGTTMTFSGGSCVTTGGGLTVNIGTYGPGTSAPRPDYFGVAIEKAPGAFDTAVVSIVKDNKRYTVGKASGIATVNGATFSGKLMRTGGSVQGSFTC
jgi:hypothetical protein